MSAVASPSATQTLPRPRRNWPAALRALRALMANKDDTEQVFHVMAALNGGDDVKIHRKMLTTVAGGQVAYRRIELLDRLTDRDWLATFAPGTVGDAYRQFLEATGYTADGLAEISKVSGDVTVEHPYAWVGRRSRDLHDIWHILTGYKTDEHVGELALVAFSYAQMGGLGWGAIAFAAWLETLSSGLRNPQGRAIFEGYRHGRQAAWLMAEDYETLLAEPLVDARRRLGIKSPEIYLSIPPALRAQAMSKPRKAPKNSGQLVTS